MRDLLDQLNVKQNEDGSYTVLVRVQFTARDLTQLRQDLLPQLSHPEAGIRLMSDEEVVTQGVARIVAGAPGWRHEGLHLRWAQAALGETLITQGPNAS